MKPQEFLENVFNKWNISTGDNGRVILGESDSLYSGKNNIGFNFVVLHEHDDRELIIACAMSGDGVEDETDYRIFKLYDEEDFRNFIADRIKEAKEYWNESEEADFYSLDMIIEDFELKHVAKGERVAEGTFKCLGFQQDKKEELTEQITDMVFKNFCEGERFSNVQSAHKDTILCDEDENGDSDSFAVSVSDPDCCDRCTFSVSYE